MSSKKKKKNIRLKTKMLLFHKPTQSINQLRHSKNQITAENINSILDRHFSTLELIKFNLFGEDFENYGNIVINGETYYPYKLNLDYLAKQQSDEIKSELDIDVDILNSLKKADDMSNINFKKITSNNFNKRKLSKNLSAENIITFGANKNKKEINDNKLKLPNIYKFNFKFHRPKLNFASDYMKLILLKNLQTPIDILNSKEFILRKNSYLKRHVGASKLNKKLDKLEIKYKAIDNEINNDLLMNKEKVPQFQFRYRYVESKFKI